MNKPGKGLRASRAVFLTAVAVMLIAATTTVLAAGKFAGGARDDRDEDHERGAYAIGLWGDLPYSDVQATVGVPNLIADMNRHDLAFTAHDGDLKAGSGIAGSTTPTTCSDALYAQGLKYLDSLKAPAVLTPGDNDWTDCDRPANGGFSSLERLDHERRVFFNTPLTLGQHHFRQEVQTDPLCLGVGGKVPCARKSPLDSRWHHLRDSKHSGFLQQSLRHGA